MLGEGEHRGLAELCDLGSSHATSLRKLDTCRHAAGSHLSWGGSALPLLLERTAERWVAAAGEAGGSQRLETREPSGNGARRRPWAQPALCSQALVTDY